MDFQSLLYFTAASVVLTLAPGPDILYLIAKSVADGAKSGVVLAAGLCTGLIFHTALVACGVAALIHGSETLFRLLRYAGAAYLLYLAWMSLKESAPLAAKADAARTSFRALYGRGVLMNVLNPKVILFFLAFLPQFIVPERGGAPAQVLLLGAVFGAQAFVVFSLTAFTAGLVRRRVLGSPRFAGLMGRVQAAVLGCIAFALVFG